MHSAGSQGDLSRWPHNCRLQAQPSAAGLPLVLAPCTKASFLLKSLTPFSGVATSLDSLPGVIEEPVGPQDSWSEVCPYGFL
jgi:hypothetical protein